MAWLLRLGAQGRFCSWFVLPCLLSVAQFSLGYSDPTARMVSLGGHAELETTRFHPSVRTGSDLQQEPTAVSGFCRREANGRGRLAGSPSSPGAALPIGTFHTLVAGTSPLAPAWVTSVLVTCVPPLTVTGSFCPQALGFFNVKTDESRWCRRVLPRREGVSADQLLVQYVRCHFTSRAL